MDEYGERDITKQPFIYSVNGSLHICRWDIHSIEAAGSLPPLLRVYVFKGMGYYVLFDDLTTDQVFGNNSLQLFDCH